MFHGYEECINEAKNHLKIISHFKEKYGMTNNENSDNSDPLLYIGVVKTDDLGDVIDDIQAYYGEPYKRGGDPAYQANLNDTFIKTIGGVRADQIVYKKELADRTDLFCAVWPWTSKPEFTSIRIGCTSYYGKYIEELIDGLAEEFAKYKEIKKSNE